MKAQLIDKIIDCHSPAVDRNLQISKNEYATRWRSVQDVRKKRGYYLTLEKGYTDKLDHYLKKLKSPIRIL